MAKCPACGYNPNQKSKPYREVISLLSQRGIICKNKIKEASDKIMLEIPSDNDYFKYYLFIRGLNKIEDKYIITSISNYMFHRRWSKGKGFSYLKGMIINSKINSGKLLSNEYKSLGKPPSRIIIEETNNVKKKRKTKIEKSK